ncbi:TRAP transporter small permease [Reyranella sp.]|uniref:TRAP transporter small permease n=1 Tax=Reyranella sp. TaxID=1929291 RepID=UPI003BACFFDD
MRGIGRVLTVTANAMLWAGAVAILAMMLHVAADVILKVALNAPIMGTLEIVSFIYMVACTFLPLPHVLASRGLIVVELFTQKMAPRDLLRLDAIVGVATVIYLALLGVMGILRAIDKMEIGETQDATYFELPVWPMRWILAAACGLAAVVALYNIFDDLHLRRTGQRYDGTTKAGLGDHHL